MSTEPTNKPMTTELFHAYSVPPHCSARSRQMMAGINMAVPSRSSFSTRAYHVSWSGLSTLSICKKKKMATIAAPPIGKLT